MCTVTYLPLPDGYILTSSRDENPGRPTSASPQIRKISGKKVVLPQDQLAGGTWIAASENVSLCLLNGAFTKHISQPPYRHSRGLVILSYFTYLSTDDFIANFPFEGLEPFTLIVVESRQLTELRWDGKKLHWISKPPHQAHLWASATLYAPVTLEKRNLWFRHWLDHNPGYSVENIRHFHLTAGDGNEENDIFMHRALVQTVSLTSIVQKEAQLTMWYQSFLAENDANGPVMVNLPAEPIING